MIRRLLKVLHSSAEKSLPTFFKMLSRSPNSPIETAQMPTADKLKQVFEDTKPAVASRESLESVPKFTHSAQSVMSEHKGASENEDAVNIVHEGNSLKMIVCDGVSNNWCSGVVARGFVDLATRKDFWSIDEITPDEVERLKNAWIQGFKDSPFFKEAEANKSGKSVALNFLEKKSGATSFNQVQITYDSANKRYTARTWILGNGGLLIINKSKPPRIICNGEDSLVSSHGQGFTVGKNRFEMAKTSGDINWDLHQKDIPLESGDICYLMSDGIANAFLQFSRETPYCEMLFQDLTEADLRKLQNDAIKNGWIEDDDASFARVAIGE